MKVLVLLSLISGALTQGCDIACTDVYEPVCGSDGNTYSNVCELKVAVCKSADAGTQLSFASTGECQTKPIVSNIDASTLTSTKCQMNCDSTEKYPVCGTDGVTYANKCYFYEAQCVYDSQGVRFDLAYVGECRDPSASLTAGSTCNILRCDSTPAKICGSDGNYYGSDCELQKAQCRDPSLTQVRCASSLSTAVTDMCADDAILNCDSTRVKVCGSDGNVYSSQCEFLKVKCSTSDNTLAKVQCSTLIVPDSVKYGTLG